MTKRGRAKQTIEKPDDLTPNTSPTTGSSVWQYFHISKKQDDYVWCIIDRCGDPCVKRCNSGTTSLHRHLKSHHPSIIFSGTGAGQRTIREVLNDTKKPGYNKAKTKLLNDLITRYIISSCSPFAVVDNHDFLKLVSELSEQRFVPMGRTKLTGCVDDLYRNMMAVIIKDMENHSISITADAALLHNNESYMAVTGHYITDDWQLRDVVLAVFHMVENHTGEYISELLERVCEEWDCGNRLFGAVTDNGANYVKGMRINQRVTEELRCSVHTIQLALKDAAETVADIDTLIKQTKDIVNKIRGSSTLRAALKEEQQKHLEALGDACETSHCYSLINDVATRFNSICMVFSRMLKLKPAVQAICREKLDVSLTAAQWSNMKEYREVLIRVKDVSNLLESSHTPSLGMAAATICSLLQQLTDLWSNIDSASCKDFCIKVRDNIRNRLGPALARPSSQLSLMLDPRVRSKEIPLWSRETCIATLRDNFAVFDYSKFVGANAAARQSSSSSSLASSSSSSSIRSGVASVASISNSSAISVDETDQKDDDDDDDDDYDNGRLTKRQRVTKHLKEIVSQRAERSEIDLYLEEGGIDINSCALEWWKSHHQQYPTLANMARVYLAVPSSSAASERAFSHGSHLLSDRRLTLHPDRVSRLIFMKYNMKLFRELSSSH